MLLKRRLIGAGQDGVGNVVGSHHKGQDTSSCHGIHVAIAQDEASARDAVILMRAAIVDNLFVTQIPVIDIQNHLDNNNHNRNSSALDVSTMCGVEELRLTFC